MHVWSQSTTITHLGIAIEELISESSKGLEKVSLNTPGRFHCHLGSILKDGHWELWAGHACQPQSEVTMYLGGGRERVRGGQGKQEMVEGRE